MDVFSFHLPKAEDNISMFFPLLKAKDNTSLFIPLLKAEDNTWMFFSFQLRKSEDNT